jgi:hypothetical protein
MHLIILRGEGERSKGKYKYISAFSREYCKNSKTLFGNKIIPKGLLKYIAVFLKKISCSEVRTYMV